MRNKMIRFVSACLCLSMLCGVSAYAVEMRSSQQIKSCYATLSRGSSNNLSLSLYISSNGLMDTLGVSSVIVQRNNGSTWVDEYTCTIENMSSLQKSDTNIYLNALTYTPNYSGYSYRAVVTFYAQDSSGSSTTTVTTNSV